MRPHLENYKPPYLFNSNGTLRHAAHDYQPSRHDCLEWRIFRFHSGCGEYFSSVVLMRPGASTHSFDMEQRMVRVVL